MRTFGCDARQREEMRGSVRRCYDRSLKGHKLDARLFGRPARWRIESDCLGMAGRRMNGSMRTISIDLPETAFAALNKAPDEFARNMRMAAAVKWYELDELS